MPTNIVTLNSNKSLVPSFPMITFYGITGALIEIIIFLLMSFIVKHNYYADIDPITYYWSLFSLLTAFWETCFVINYNTICNYAAHLQKENKHVWFSQYSVSMILPWNVAKIFYAEYGAFADREYMYKLDDWARIIESTHALMCGSFLGTSIIIKNNDNERSNILMDVGAGCQLMNSVLYLGQYVIQCRDKWNINFVTDKFPIRVRYFMLINIFWTIMPLYIILNRLGFC